MSSSPTTRRCCQRNEAHTSGNGQLEKPMQKYKCLSKPTASHMTSWSTQTALSQGTSLVGGSQSSRVEGLCTKTVEPTVMASSLTMEVEAVTHAIQWLASQRDARITHAVILTDSMNLLQKVESGMGCPNWHTAMHSLRLQRLLWIYCPGHAGVSGNERADRLASTADITSGLQLGRAEVLRGLRNFLNTDKPEHHSTDHLKERGVEKGSGRHSTLQGRQRSVFNQANIGIVSRATLGKRLRDEAERVWAFPSATMPSWAEAETETETWEVGFPT